MSTSTRRDFLKTMAAGGLLLSIDRSAKAAKAAETAPQWLRIAPDGTVTILTNTSEIGQGTGTGIAQLLGDELDVAWEQIRLEMAPVEKAYFNPGWGEYATYGSGGIQYQVEGLRLAGARARAVLIMAAAQRWNVKAEDCTTTAGTVRGPGGRTLTYGALAADAAKLPLPEKPPLKSKEAWVYIGKPMPRIDLPAKVDGSAVYGIDVKLPGLLVATIAQCPRFGGKLKSVDPSPALAVKGVKRVIELENAVAVVATGYWPARNGLQALKPEWDLANASTASSPEYAEKLLEGAKSEGTPFAPKDTTPEKLAQKHDEAMAKAAKKIEAIYQVPFVAHATMEPMNATARPMPGGIELWLPTQSQSASRALVAKRLGAGEESVAPVAPAVVNALFAATGKRYRSLPLSREGIVLA